MCTEVVWMGEGVWGLQYEEGNYGTALGMYLRLAEAGYEVGQSNAAWMLQRGYGIDSAGAAILAHRLNQRAAGQVGLSK